MSREFLSIRPFADLSRRSGMDLFVGAHPVGDAAQDVYQAHRPQG
jgi:hypothetical protein